MSDTVQRHAVADVEALAPRLVAGGEIGACLHATDWASTPLGPIACWPHSLVSYVNMIHAMPSPAIIFWGREQTQIYNAAYATIMGPRHPRYFGAPYRECWPDTYPLIHPWMQRVLKYGEALKVDSELIPVTRYGFTEEAYFSFTFSPLRDDDGAIAGILQPVFEVTDNVLSERRAATLRALAPRADSLDPLQDAVDAIAANSRDLPFALIYLWNAAEKTLKLAARSDSIADESIAPAGLFAAAREVFAAGTPRRIDDADALLGGRHLGPWPEPARSALILPFGRATDAGVRGVAVFGISPRLHFDDKYRSFLEVAASQVATALTSRRALQEAQRHAAALAEIDQAKTEFFNNVSHEFRTPLTLMLGPVEDLLAGVHGEVFGTKRLQLGLIHRNALRLQKLVNTLLDFSRIEAGRLAASFEPVDLATLTRDVASTFRSAIESAGLGYTIDCPPLDESVYVDREMWEKIVLNLLSNAFKFTLKGSIAVTLRSLETDVELRVADTGTGIAQAEIPRIFERFHRVSRTRGRTQEGSGIGLALVRELVRLHGGVIDVTSALDQGSAFTVRIPKGVAHIPPEQIAASQETTPVARTAFVDEALRWLPDARGRQNADAAQAHGPSRIARFTPSCAGRILLADDNADMRAYIRRLLEPHWTVQAAENGPSALAAARANPPDLILLDVMLPGIDGLALLQKLRWDKRTRNVPVMILSTRSSEDSRAEGLEAGAEDYLAKPFSARELLARVNAQLELAKLRRAIETERQNVAHVFRQAPVAIAVWRGPDHVFELANTFYLRLFGRSDVIGKTVREAFPDRDLERRGTWDIWDRVYETGETYTHSHYAAQLDGSASTRRFAFTLAALGDENDAINGLVAVAVEVGND